MGGQYSQILYDISFHSAHKYYLIYTPIVRKVLIYRAKEDKVAVILYLAPKMGKSKCRVNGRITKSFGRSLCHAWRKGSGEEAMQIRGDGISLPKVKETCVSHTVPR